MKYTVMLDFDGTVVEHSYPKMGRCNFGCIEVIKKLQVAGHKIILNTYRANLNNGTLEQALKLLNEQYWMCLKDRKNYKDFTLEPIVEFTKEKIDPPNFDFEYFKKNKTIYIDDVCFGTPLKPAVVQTHSKMVDWEALDLEFEKQGIYNC